MADQEKHQLEKVVGQTIAKRRQSLGISQFELAERLNIAPASLSRIENGLAAPRFSRGCAAKRERASLYREKYSSCGCS